MTTIECTRCGRVTRVYHSYWSDPKQFKPICEDCWLADILEIIQEEDKERWARMQEELAEDGCAG